MSPQNPEAAPAAAPEAQPPSPAPKTEEAKIQEALDAIDAAEKAGEGEVRDTDPKPPEQPAEPKTEPEKTPEEKRLSDRFAELARRDRAQRERHQSLSAREARMAEIEAKAAKYDQQAAELAEEAKKDPWGVLKKLGVDVYEALGSLGGDDKPDATRESKTISELRAQVQDLAKRIDDRHQQEQQERAKQREASVYGAALRTIHNVISRDPEAHEAILELGQQGLGEVFQALDGMYQQLKEDTGRDPGPPDADDILAAARIVEQVHREQELADLAEKAKRRRFAGRLTLGEPPIKGDPKATAPAASPSTPTTLNNDLQSTPPQKRKLLTDEERFAAAMAIPFDGGKSG